MPIDSYPGTTVQSGTYVFRSGERELFHIVDTPGFQEPRRVLAWLQERARNPGERVAAVRAFVAEFAVGERFRDEVELLRPILDGAGILYVVDASSPFQPANEAEMEVLRWTGQPGMALLNRIRERDHAAEWRPILEQFFNIVREFDAHGAAFDDRIALLRGFGELRESWRPPVEAAIVAMQEEWRDRARRAARELADLMVDALSHVGRQPLPDGADAGAARTELESTYREHLRDRERQARDAVERIYRHPELQRVDDAVEILGEDLFSETAWKLFGLTPAQMAKQGALWGAAAGAVIDLMVGGLSFFVGAAAGGVVGGLAGWFGTERVARVWGSQSKLARMLFPGETGRFLAMGPVTNPGFAWVLLDRALVHHRAVKDRSHARRDELKTALPPEEVHGIVASLDRDQRAAVDKELRAVLQRIAKGKDLAETRSRLTEALLPLLA